MSQPQGQVGIALVERRRVACVDRRGDGVERLDHGGEVVDRQGLVQRGCLLQPRSDLFGLVICGNNVSVLVVNQQIAR